MAKLTRRFFQLGSAAATAAPTVRLFSSATRRPILGVIIGPPGSGKGTISNRIVRDFELAHLSSGDLIRQHMNEKTPFGLQIAEHVNKGELIDTKVLAPLMETELEAVEQDPPFHGWLLDGYPRTVEQAELLHKKYPPNVVIYLNVPFRTIVDRVKSRWIHVPSGRVYNTEFNPPKEPFKDDITGEKLIQRPDDEEANVYARLMTYKLSTDPVIHHYANKYAIVQEFKGTESNVIYPKVKEFLELFQSA